MFSFRELVVYIWWHSLSEAGGVVQDGCGLSSPNAQTGNSLCWAENFQLFPGHLAPISGNFACRKDKREREREKKLDSNVYKSLLTIVLLLQVSEKAGHIIEYDKFYIHELDDLVDIRNDYITWFQRQMFPSVSLLVTIACLSNYFIQCPGIYSYYRWCVFSHEMIVAWWHQLRVKGDLVEVQHI